MQLFNIPISQTHNILFLAVFIPKDPKTQKKNYGKIWNGKLKKEEKAEKKKNWVRQREKKKRKEKNENQWFLGNW